jgi:predicted O-methyltransferase YrrM
LDNKVFDNWFDYSEFYDEMAEKIPENGIAIEVGVFMGASIIHLTKKLNLRNKEAIVVAVDTFQGSPNEPNQQNIINEHGGNLYNTFLHNIEKAGVRDNILIVPKESTEAAQHFYDGIADFIFIDASHDYESVKNDITAWLPKLRRGGIISGHDYDFPDVQKAVLELLPQAEEYRRGHVWFYQKG